MQAYDQSRPSVTGFVAADNFEVLLGKSVKYARVRYLAAKTALKPLADRMGLYQHTFTRESRFTVHQSTVIFWECACVCNK